MNLNTLKELCRKVYHRLSDCLKSEISFSKSKVIFDSFPVDASHAEKS